MTTNKDHYQILGVMPDAERIVIVAAYRALASHYHPDRWKGDHSEATKKMADINVAYGIIGDPLKRAEYDCGRNAAHQNLDEDTDEQEEMFDQALDEYEEKWNLACDIYPDLKDIKSRLNKTARRLSFAFVIQIIDAKKYKFRHELANAMEDKFLQTYFGENKAILKYARELISWGFKDAIKKLNSFVDLLGDELDSEVVINKIEKDLSLKERRDKLAREKGGTEEEQRNLARLRAVINFHPIGEHTLEYARISGYKLNVTNGGLFSPDSYEIRLSENGPILFKSQNIGQMSLWIINNVVNKR